jgi:hypothetical protein
MREQLRSYFRKSRWDLIILIIVKQLLISFIRVLYNMNLSGKLRQQTQNALRGEAV